jgi:hypothetical protein
VELFIGGALAARAPHSLFAMAPMPKGQQSPCALNQPAMSWFIFVVANRPSDRLFVMVVITQRICCPIDLKYLTIYS